MRRVAVLTMGLWLLAASVGSAQWRGGLREVRSRRDVRRSRTWGELGLGVSGGAPVGQFGDLVTSVGGVNANLTAHIDRSGTLGLRIEGSYLLYGNERRPLPLAGTGGLLAVDMNTAFYVASLRAGPELVLGTGRVRPYAFGTAGVAYFATKTSFGGCCGTTNYNDAVTSFAGGGGLRFDLSRRRHRVALDLGATYVRNGKVNYVPQGGIVANSDGSFTLQPIRSDADFVVVQAGLSFGLR